MLVSLLLQAVLRASLDAGALSVDKFSRWLRAICTRLLARNGASDRTKALGYIDQAVEVMRDVTNWLRGRGFALI